MPYYIVRPEVPGQLGDSTVMDRREDQLRVSHLEFAFDGWRGDELITAHPAFAATKSLAHQFINAGLTGVQLRDMAVSRSDEFEELYPALQLPEFVELVITGTAGVDDFGIMHASDLVISQRALDILNTTKPVDTEVLPLNT